MFDQKWTESRVGDAWGIRTILDSFDIFSICFIFSWKVSYCGSVERWDLGDCGLSCFAGAEFFDVTHEAGQVVMQLFQIGSVAWHFIAWSTFISDVLKEVMTFLLTIPSSGQWTL